MELTSGLYNLEANVTGDLGLIRPTNVGVEERQDLSINKEPKGGTSVEKVEGSRGWMEGMRVEGVCVDVEICMGEREEFKI